MPPVTLVNNRGATLDVSSVRELQAYVINRGWVPQSGTYADAYQTVTGQPLPVVQDVAVPTASVNGLAVGESTFSRITSGTNLTISTGQVRLTYFTATKSQTVTQVRLYSGATAAAATPTLARVGLYSVSADGATLTLLGATANDTALFAAANTAYTRNITPSVTTAAGQRYALATIVVSGATMPQLTGISTTLSAEAGIEPRITGLLTGQTDLPGTIAASATIASGSAVYAALLPSSGN